MNIVSIKENRNYLSEYCRLCIEEWGTYNISDELENKIKNKANKILSNKSDVISILGLIENNFLIGVISLFKIDGEERQDLTPWYATMYVKKEYRKNNYSKLLDKAIKQEAKKLGYKKIYLKSNLHNYYEKFGAIEMEKLKNGETLYYINLIDRV
ncbi:MAG: GNAT family N-acetyltransferase [Bacilli bacterium]|nr:GNAT family N-acetyltransferase [Bacilli bacterium]